ncbi:MAG: hypothetical protein WBE72_19010 [Terracidiphilus sp.]
MRRLWWIPICLAAALAVPVAVLARGDSGFDGVVNSIESRYHARATRIPFLGVVSLIAGKATRGVRGVQVAEFDNFSAQVDGDELNGIVEQKLGQGWERMIRVTSRKCGEQTLIFARPRGDRMELFVLDLEGHELDVVEVSVDPDHLNESIGKYEHHDGDVTD